MKYDILEELGRGKFGRVYRGKNARTGETVAIKCETEPVILKHEARVLHFLHRAGCREGVPSVHWFGEHAGKPTLVMTFMDGGSLETLMAAASADIRHRLMHYWRRLVAILRHIHSVGIVHRDIKPANCMLRGGGGGGADIFLVDFGLANTIDCDSVDSETKGVVVGTPSFMSAHVLHGRPPTRRDDLASLGYTILYCLGRLEFSDDVFGEDIEDTRSEFDAVDVRHPRNRRILAKKMMWLQEDSEPYMSYCHSLRAQEIPCYDWVCREFLNDTL
jgi:serine/threonine protein kinase